MRIAAAAQQAQAAGDTQSAAIAEAQAVRAQSEAAATATAAQLVVAAPVAIAPPVAKGISVSTKVDFEVTSLHQLVMHVAEHAELLALLKVDEVKLRAYVRGLGAACALPGVRVFETPVMSARKAA